MGVGGLSHPGRCDHRSCRCRTCARLYAAVVGADGRLIPARYGLLTDWFGRSTRARRRKRHPPPHGPRKRMGAPRRERRQPLFAWSRPVRTLELGPARSRRSGLWRRHSCRSPTGDLCRLAGRRTAEITSGTKNTGAELPCNCSYSLSALPASQRYCIAVRKSRPTTIRTSTGELEFSPFRLDRFG